MENDGRKNTEMGLEQQENANLRAKLKEFDEFLEYVGKKKGECQKILIDLNSKLNAVNAIFKYDEFKDGITAYLNTVKNIATQHLENYVAAWGRLNILKRRMVEVEGTIDSAEHKLAYHSITTLKDKIKADLDAILGISKKYKIDTILETYSADFSKMLKFLTLDGFESEMEEEIETLQEEVKRLTKILEYEKKRRRLDENE